MGDHAATKSFTIDGVRFPEFGAGVYLPTPPTAFDQVRLDPFDDAIAVSGEVLHQDGIRDVVTEWRRRGSIDSELRAVLLLVLDDASDRSDVGVVLFEAGGRTAVAGHMSREDPLIDDVRAQISRDALLGRLLTLRARVDGGDADRPAIGILLD